MSNRIEAFENLMGTTYPISEDEYPPFINLPGFVYEKALDALSETVQDGNERSMHFRYRQNRWRGGIAIRGKKARASTIHTNSSLLLPPHLHSHTHPDVSDEELEQVVEESRITGIDSEDYRRTIQQILHINHRTPSSDDVFRSLHEPGGSVGHLLVSSYGSFAWIHTDLAATKGIFENTFSSQYRSKTQFARDRKRYVEEKDKDAYTSISSINFLWKTVLETRAKALAPSYVCYVGNPQNSELTRVDSKV